jgi:hypothetical protein
MNATITPLVVLSLFASNALAQTHCIPPEQTFFSCKIRGTQKVASLCGVSTMGGDNEDSWLQYRFGRLGVIEFRYPRAKEKSIPKFQGEFHRSAMGSDDSLWFTNHGTTYSLEVVDTGKHQLFRVWAAGKMLPCSGKATLNGFADIAVSLTPREN